MEMYGILLFLSVGGFSNALFFTRLVCYDHIGCFSNGSPYTNTKGLLPESPDHIQAQFLLVTRQNPNQRQALNPYDKNTVTHSNFVATKQTKIIIHGYQDSGHGTWMARTAKEFIRKDDFNVIIVNWEKGADNLNYIQAAANTRVVGATIGQLIKTLHSLGASYQSFHLIGHSLGSHISGYAGESLHGQIGRITGLDPAGPLFEKFDAPVRLDPTDAHYVDAIHTDSDNLHELGFGLEKPLGHADFYPNGGEKQPGCIKEIGHHLFNLITLQIERFSDTIACSHMRVLDLFTESINSHCHFTAYPCASKADYDAGRCHTCGHGCSVMGLEAAQHRHAHGRFYFGTSAHAPFCV